MTRLSLFALVLAYAGATSTEAAIINVGSHDLLPNTPNQSVLIYATAEPDELVTGFRLFARTGDGHPDYGGGATLEPVFQDVDFGGGVWDAFPNTPMVNPVVGYPMYAHATVAFNVTEQTVSPNGLVAKLIIDTTGLFSGTYALNLSDIIPSSPGDVPDSEFLGFQGVGIPIEIINGQLNIVPEPSALTILLLCGTMMACGTSWARRRRVKS